MRAHHRFAKVRISVVIILCTAIVAAGVWVWLELFATYHYAVVTPGVLYRDGNRSMREFTTACRKAQPKTVVMLNDDQEIQKDPFKSEIEFCSAVGIELVRIPVPLGGRPVTQDIHRFLEVVSNPKHQPVLVHCAQGVRRTAMMVAAYQESVLGYDDAKVKSAILPFGRKPTSDTLEDIRQFIDDYDGRSRKVGGQQAHIDSSDRE